MGTRGRRLWRRIAAGVIAVAAVAGVATSTATAGPVNLDGTWEVTLSDPGCMGGTQGPHPMIVTAFDASSGSFQWSFPGPPGGGGGSSGTGTESGSTVTFNDFGGGQNLTAQLSDSNGTLTMVSYIGTCQNNGGTYEWKFVLQSTKIVGAIATPFGDGWSGASVALTGTDATTGQPISMTTTTASDGTYSFSVDPGTYTVTPAVPSGWGADEYTPERCDGGSAGSGSCQTIVLQAGQQDEESFLAAYAVTGSVWNAAGKRVAGATVRFENTEQGGKHTASLVTGSGAFTERLAPGSGLVSVDPFQGTRFAPDATPDCKVAGESCQVDLTHDRTVAFCPAAARAAGAAAADWSSVRAPDAATSGLVAVAASGGGLADPCQLHVVAEALEGSPLVGLSDPPGRGVVFQEALRDEAVPPIGGEDYTHVISHTCLSGCTNIIVNVKDYAGRNLEGAKVTLRLGTLGAIMPARVLPEGDNGFLCAFGVRVCTDVAEDTTDRFGNAYFRYWLPGVVNTGDGNNPIADLYASAEVNGAKCGCGGHTAKGHAQSLFVTLRPHIALNRNAPLTANDLVALQALMDKKSSDAKRDERDAGWIVWLLEHARVVTTDEGKGILGQIKDLATSDQVNELLRRTPELVELDWFMAKFGIPDNGLIKDTASVTEWGRQLAKDLGPMLVAKYVKGEGKLYDYLRGKLTDGLLSASKALVGNSWVDQIHSIVDKLLAGKASGTMTLKMFEVTRCWTVKLAGNTCGTGDAWKPGLWMAFSVAGASRDYSESENIIPYNPGYWLPAVCGHHGCPEPADAPPRQRDPTVADSAT